MITTKKIFITGVFGSGKTTTAKMIEKNDLLTYLSYDKIHNYDGKCHFNTLMAHIKQNPEFVMDAIPVNINSEGEVVWDKFIEWEANNKCDIIVSYCYDINVWLQRWEDREKLKYLKKKKIYDISRETLEGFKNKYLSFYIHNIKLIEKFKNTITGWDSINNEFTTIIEMKERLKWMR